MEALMMFNSRMLPAALGLALAAWQPDALARPSSAALFDDYVSAGLPRAFTLPRPVDDERGQGVDDVIVEDRLDTDVVYPDGSHATTYIGTANGREATFTRLGDVLSVSVSDEPTMPEEPPRRVRRAVLQASSEGGVVPSTAARELHFYIFLHDNAGESNYAKFHNWYIAWWVRDMERTVKPGVPVTVHIKERIAGVTDFNYHGKTVSDMLSGFQRVAANYLTPTGAPESELRKTMLFIGDCPASWDGYYGYARLNGTVAMASGTGPRHGVAHEFGHTIGAVHEDAELRFGCVTNMRSWTPPFVSCKVYSKRNDERIRTYVREELQRQDEDARRL
jgi:hypothetical protein